jgi:hypothetical protein
MCFVILLNRSKKAEERFRNRYPRLASALLRRHDPQPQYNEKAGSLQIKPVKKRPDSLKLPAYEGYRRLGHTMMEVKDSEKAVV